MPKLDIGSYYWFINKDDYDQLTEACANSGGYSMDMFGFSMYAAENDYDASYVGYYADISAIDDDEMEFIASLGLGSFDARQIMLSVQVSVF